MAMSWPIIFFERAPNETRWAHCIQYAYAAADGYIWANYFLGENADAIGWAHCIRACGSRNSNFSKFNNSFAVRVSLHKPLIVVNLL